MLNLKKALIQYIPFSQFTLKKVKIVYILRVVEEKIQNKNYICGICKLIRFEILSQLIQTLELNVNIKIRAITDGVSLNQSTLCPDYVEFNSIALSYLFSDYPIFTPIIGLDLDEIKDLCIKVSANLKEFDYCEFKPKNQEFDLKGLKELYNSLELSNLIKQNLQNAEDIKII